VAGSPSPDGSRELEEGQHQDVADVEEYEALMALGQLSRMWVPLLWPQD